MDPYSFTLELVTRAGVPGAIAVLIILRLDRRLVDVVDNLAALAEEIRAWHSATTSKDSPANP